MVKSQWVCFLFIPIAPLGKFRVKYVARNRYLSRMVRRESEWQDIADTLRKTGWTWGCTQRVDSNGQTVFVADAHRDEKRFVVRADSKVAAFVELQQQLRTQCAGELSAVGSASKPRSKYPVITYTLGAVAGVVVSSLIGLAAWDDFSRRNWPHQSGPQGIRKAIPAPGGAFDDLIPRTEIRKAIPVQPQVEPEIRKAIAVEQTQRIRELAEENSAALAAGNYGRVADLTYPKVVEMAGGREKVIDALRNGSAGIKAHGSAILPSEVNEPNEIVTVADKEFAIVPYTMRMKGANKTVQAKCFLIAISSDDGRTWTFIDGGPTKQQLSELVPDFPPKLSLPTCEQPVLEPK